MWEEGLSRTIISQGTSCSTLAGEAWAGEDQGDSAGGYKLRQDLYHLRPLVFPDSGDRATCTF